MLCFVVGEVPTEFLYAVEVYVEPASANLVAAGFGNDGVSAPSQQRTEHHHTTA